MTAIVARIQRERIVVRQSKRNTIRVGMPGPTGAGAASQIVNPTVTDGQTSFTLPTAPANALSVVVNVNTADLQNGIDFTVSGSAVTLLPALGYALKAADKVQIRYS